MPTLDDISLWYLIKLLLVLSSRVVVSGAVALGVWAAALGIASFFPIGQAGIHSDFAAVAAAIFLVVWMLGFWLLRRVLPFPRPKRVDPYARTAR